MPETRYAHNGDIAIAYQVHGDGPIDVVFVEGFITHLEIYWEEPAYRRFCERLASFSRLIRFDKRGMGLSDRTRIGTLEERMDDVRVVMDAVGSERAALLGESEGGPMSTLFAATYPERTAALLLCGAEVRERLDEEWPWGESTEEDFEAYLPEVPTFWGTRGTAIDSIAPTLANDRMREWFARLLRNAVDPAGAIAFMRLGFDIDVRDVLPSVNVPTLILHRVDETVCHVENARYMARTIPGATYVELPGTDHVPWAGGDDMLDEIREFLTGVREPEEPDRVLATVLFTDIVGSTDRATEMGDERWRDLLERHHAVVRLELARHRGREIDTAGDGFLAAFDGPARAIRCARSIVDAVATLGIQVRTGLHTGECEVVGDNLVGIAVHIGARVASAAGAGEVLVTSTVRDLVAGAGIAFDDRGTYELKGVPEAWRLFAVL
jgi:class 3 adenylate cyclase